VVNPTILIVGRLSGPKNQTILSILRNAVPAVLKKFPGARFQVVGGPVAGEHRQLEKQFFAVRFEGHQKDLKPFYQKATVVVGAGRVALEGMVMRKPIVAVGERLYLGPLLPEKVELAKATNFGDCWSEEKFDWTQVGPDLAALLQSRKRLTQAAQTGAKLLRDEYDMDKIFPQMERLYERVYLEHNLAGLHELPVLMYHRVVKQAPALSKFDIYITRENLEKHLQFLRVRGIETLTFEDLTRRRAPRKAVILTFDDGYADNYENLFPLLQKYGMKAVVYALGNRKHRNNYWDIPKGEPATPLLTDAQIRAMAASGLVEIGSHALNHVRMTELNPAALRKEVAQSREILGKLVGKPILSFAYPFGAYNEAAKQAVAEAGYRFGIAVNSPYTRFAEDLMAIRRVHMFPRSSVFDLWKKTSGFYHRYRKLTGKS